MIDIRDVIVSSFFPRHLSMAYTMPTMGGSPGEVSENTVT